MKSKVKPRRWETLHPTTLKSRRVTRRKNKMIYKENPNYTGGPRQDKYVQVGKGDTYEMVVKTPIEGGTDPSDLDAEIRQARAEYESAKAYSEELAAIYAAELAKCGKNYEQRAVTVDEVIYGEIPDYLKTEEDAQPLDVLTINDYTFITNPNVAVSMSKSDAEKRPLKPLCRSRRWLTTESTLWTSKRREQKPLASLELLISLNTDAQFTSDDAACPYNGNFTFTCDGSNLQVDRPGSQDAKNLVFELDVVGTSYQTKFPAKDPDHYRCRYRAFVTLKAGGSGWKKVTLLR